jgi:Cys-tRNA(Pro) deacylase
MRRHGIQGEILHLDQPVPTVPAAAQAVGAIEDQIVKSLLFLIDGEPLLAITCGTHRVDRRAVAAVKDVGRKKVKLASPQDVVAISGYTVGAMPPFGHRTPLDTLVDGSVVAQPVVYAGGGSDTALVRLDPREIVTATKARVLDLRGPAAP